MYHTIPVSKAHGTSKTKPLGTPSTKPLGIPNTEPLGTPNTKPLLFDQARHSLGRIWLRPQVQSHQPSKGLEEGRFLKLTFRLNESPDLAVMNEIALNLQFLPHVDQVRFEKLYAPKEQITDFMRLVLLASKLKPLLRKLHAKRQRRKLLALVAQNENKPSTSLIELHLENQQRPTCDWSSAVQVPNHEPKVTQISRDRRKKNRTWPPTEARSAINGTHSSGELFLTDTHDAYAATPDVKVASHGSNTVVDLSQESSQGKIVRFK